MSFGIRARVGPFYVHQSLHPARGLAWVIKFCIYLYVWLFMALWWVMKWSAVATYLSVRWMVMTLTPLVRRQWAALRARRVTPPAA